MCFSENYEWAIFLGQTSNLILPSVLSLEPTATEPSQMEKTCYETVHLKLLHSHPLQDNSTHKWQYILNIKNMFKYIGYANSLHDEYIFNIFWYAFQYTYALHYSTFPLLPSLYEHRVQQC